VWLHKIRRAMVNPNRTKLSGTVEIDDTPKAFTYEVKCDKIEG
jgi:hypothetical protein